MWISKGAGEGEEISFFILKEQLSSPPPVVEEGAHVGQSIAELPTDRCHTPCLTALLSLAVGQKIKCV